ncbi:MAG: AAA family ATPase [Desulfurococcaceae archaeon]|nr:AAA family ATPase [Desulfurococcaceae archaeon]
MVRVVVSGPPGSGKTTQAKLIAEHFKLKYFSAGRVFREIALKRGVGVDELSVLATRDPSIDIEVDKKTFEIAHEDNIVIDAHLGAWIVGDIVDIKVYVTAPFALRVLRIATRDNIPVERALRETLIREVSQKRRFMEFYGIDVSDLSIFDVVVNTKNINAERAFKIIRKVIENDV